MQAQRSGTRQSFPFTAFRFLRLRQVRFPLPIRLAVALLATLCPGQARPLSIAANTATNSYDPVSGIMYLEMRNRLKSEFPGTTFTSLPQLTGDLSQFDLIILNRFSAPDLQPAEQTAVRSYVNLGGSVVYIGESINASGSASNDTFTLPFGVAMIPDPATDLDIAYASYTNGSHPFLTGPFGMPSDAPSGSHAAQVSTLGLSVELARWDGGGGVAISAFPRGRLTSRAGFGIFVTDVNMITPGRYAYEFDAVLANALSSELVVKPDLAIVRVAGGVRLSWSADAAGWTLQGADALASWSDLGLPIVSSGFYDDISSRKKRFYRLRK